MPSKYRKFKKRKLYKNRLRRKQKGVRSLTCNALGGFPWKYFAKFRVQNSHTLTFSAAANQYLYFKINSPLTPIDSQNATGLANLLGLRTDSGAVKSPYTNFIVRGCKITCQISTEVSSTINVIPFYCIAPLAKGTTAYTGNVFALGESPMSKGRYFNANISGNSMGTAVSNAITKYWNMHDIVGLSKRTDLRSIDNLIGNYNTDPTDLYLGCIGATTDGGNTDATLAVGISMQITYYVELFNRNNLTLSAPA